MAGLPHPAAHGLIVNILLTGYHINIFTASLAQCKIFSDNLEFSGNSELTNFREYKLCAGTAESLLQILIQSVVQRAVKTAEKICAHVKTAVFFSPVRAATAVKAARKDSPTRNARIFAIGFLLTRNSVPIARVIQKRWKKLKPQEMHSIIYLTNYE